MRKPIDYDAELKALNERAKALRTRQRDRLGELVLATGAGTLSIDVLAGALLAAAASDAATKEVWRAGGAAYFRQPERRSARRSRGDARGAPAGNGGAQSTAGDAGAS